jgi:hypothetical protein
MARRIRVAVSKEDSSRASKIGERIRGIIPFTNLLPKHREACMVPCTTIETDDTQLDDCPEDYYAQEGAAALRVRDQGDFSFDDLVFPTTFSCGRRVVEADFNPDDDQEEEVDRLYEQTGEYPIDLLESRRNPVELAVWAD